MDKETEINGLKLDIEELSQLKTKATREKVIGQISNLISQTQAIITEVNAFVF